jgi:ubiquitin-protein ligase
MSTLRLRRLSADYEKLRQYIEQHPRLKLVRAAGDPPELYEIEYKIVSLRQTAEGLERVPRHTVEIQLPRDYPRVPPQCRMLTPVFHPNIAPHAICVGDHWSAGEPIWSIVARIGEILSYQSYNTKSPLNGEAAKWVAENVDDLPLDHVSMLIDEDQAARPAAKSAAAAAKRQAAAATRPAATAPAPKAAAATLGVLCPGCGAQYRLAATFAGKRARCPKCQTIINVPAGRAGSSP